MKQLLKILFVEDLEEDYDLILLALKRDGFSIESRRIQTEIELITSLQDDTWDMIISDNQLPSLDGKRALEIVRNFNHDIPFILVSGAIGVEAAVEAMHAGANDYVLKDNIERLAPVIEREIRESSKRTKQRLNNKKLILSELKFQQLTESIKDIFFALDSNLNIVFWNDAAQRAFNKTDVLNKNIYDIIPEWKGKPAEKIITSSIKDYKSQTISFISMTDEVEYYEGTVFPTAEGGVTLLLKNITENRLNSANLIKLNNELESLLYKISHDLKGPVASVIGLLDIISIDEKFSEDTLFTMMNKCITRLNRTLNDLSNISIIKFDKPVIQNLNIRQTIQGLIDHENPGSNININIEIDKDLVIKSDITLFKCIWQNLIDNAIVYSYMNRNNLITINAKMDNDNIVMRITDTGQGIPEEIHHRIYEMFFRGNERSTGPGLGLYIVKNALSKINGTIEIDNNYVDGSRFDLVLPKF